MALCDATMMAGVALPEKLKVLLLAACLRIAASNEGGVVLEAATVADLVDFPGTLTLLMPLKRNRDESSALALSHRASKFWFLLLLHC